MDMNGRRIFGRRANPKTLKIALKKKVSSRQFVTFLGFGVQYDNLNTQTHTCTKTKASSAEVMKEEVPV